MLGDRRFALSCPVFLAASAVVLTLADRSAWGTTYTPTNVGALIGGATTSTPTALNASDQVVGYYYTTASGGSASSPFVYTPGTGGTTGTVVTVPGTYTSYTSEATGINDAGLVVGFNETSLTAFTYNVSNGAFNSIPSGSGNYQIELAGVNASGIAVGSLRDTTTYQPSAIAYNTVTNTITNVGAGFSGESVASNGYSYSINNSGVIAATGGCTARLVIIARP